MMMMRLAVSLILGLAASAQSPEKPAPAAAAAAAQPVVGVTPAWELKKQIAALVEQSGRLAPLIDEVKPASWPAEAPTAYRDQQTAAKKEIGYLAQTAAALARDPEKMPLALDAYLRLNALERMLDSLSEGVRRYQNPALADLIQGTISENSTHRNRLQSYLIELIATKQEELRIAGDEAQACRSTQLRSAPVSSRPRPRKDP